MAKKNTSTKTAKNKVSEKSRKEPVIGDLEADSYLLRSSAESLTPEKPNLSENEKNWKIFIFDRIYLLCGIDNFFVEKLDERIALLDEHHTNIELLIGAASRTVEKQRLYALGSAGITVGGLIISQ